MNYVLYCTIFVLYYHHILFCLFLYKTEFGSRRALDGKHLPSLLYGVHVRIVLAFGVFYFVCVL